MTDAHKVLAMCVAKSFDDIEMNTEVCGHRWVAFTPEGTDPFRLECPHCGKQDSFVSFCPPGWIVGAEQ